MNIFKRIFPKVSFLLVTTLLSRDTLKLRQSLKNTIYAVSLKNSQPSLSPRLCKQVQENTNVLHENNNLLFFVVFKQFRLRL